MLNFISHLAHNIFQNIGPMLFYFCFFAFLFMIACGIEWLLELREKRRLRARPSMRDWK